MFCLTNFKKLEREFQDGKKLAADDVHHAMKSGVW